MKVLPLLARILPKEGHGRDMVKVAGGTTAAHAIGLLLSPLLTRLYTPEQFGTLAVSFSLIVIVSIVSTFKYEIAIPIPAEDRDGAALVLVSLSCVGLLVVAYAAALWFLRGDLPRWVGMPGLRPYLWVIPISFGGVGAYMALSHWALRKSAMTEIATTRFSQGAMTSVSQTLLGFLRVGTIGLLAGDMLGRLTGVTQLARLAWNEDQAVFKSIRWAHMLRVAKQYKNFPLISGPAAILNSASLYLPAILFSIFFGPQVTGWISLGQRLILLPMVVTGQAVAQVYLAKAAVCIREDPAQLYPLVKGISKKLLIFGLVPIGLLALLGPWICQKVFGAGWVESGILVRIMTPMYLMQILVSPISQTFNLLERQKTQLLLDASRLAVVVLAIALPANLGLSHRGTVLAYAAGMTLMDSITFALIHNYARRLMLSPNPGRTID